ncbi:MAG: DUF998 domain-containing protein [archaeon]|nr:DUF998 domain-containing protein [archaeon]
MFIYPLSILFGYLVAQLDLAGPGNDPAGYNIVENFISDMGNYKFTPIPKILDNACMITAILMVPCILYMKKALDSADKEPRAMIRKVFGNIAQVTMLLGVIGLWGLGFFSEGVSNALQEAVWHNFNSHVFFTIYMFPLIAVGGFFIGLIFITNNRLIDEIFAVNYPKYVTVLVALAMLVLTPVCCVIFIVDWQVALIVPPSAPFWEWMFLFSIMIWLFALSFYSLSKIRKDLASEI